MLTKNEQSEAQYRVYLKRVIRQCGHMVSPAATSEGLGQHFKALVARFPDVVANSLDLYWAGAAKDWEDGNNSGCSATLARKERDSQRKTDALDQIMSLLGVNVDYPGLHPSFSFNGRCYHSTMSVLRAYAETI